MTEKELTEVEVLKSAENLKKWCDEHFEGEECECPFAGESTCKLYASCPKFWNLPKPKPRISDFEYEFLKRIDSQFEYIARDKAGGLCVFKGLPVKHKYSVIWSDGDCYMQFVGIRDLFTFIQWEDLKPTSVRELMKEYEKYHAEG